MDDDDDGVYTLPDGEIAAVVSGTAQRDYCKLKRQQALRHLVTHQRVVELVMQSFPVLPVKFGTVLSDQAQVRQVLEQGSSLFRATLEKFMGKVQMEVVVLWNLQQVFEEISREECIVQLRAQAATRPPAESMAERVMLGRLVEASLAQRRATLCNQLEPALREVALDLVSHPPMDDSMVVNVALLVDEPGRERLDQRLKTLDEQFGRQLTFRCVGPLPPYSFATVEIHVPSFELVDAARQCLTLGETVTLSEIQRAYHQVARRLHPDHNPDNSNAETQMAELTRAYHLLTAYAESQALFGGEGDALVSQYPCTMTRERVERTLLISIDHQELPA